MPRVILLGAPGSGKGTQAEFLEKEYNIPTISTGDLLRDNIAENTPIGLKAQKYMDDGALVPDDLVISLVEDRFSKVDATNGWVLDGFPRTEKQAMALDELLHKNGKKLDQVFHLSTSRDVLMERILSRLVCPECEKIYNTKTMPPKVSGICDSDGATLVHREDDTVETATHRIDVYVERTRPLIEYYKNKGVLFEVNGLLNQDEIEKIISEKLGS